MNSEHLRKVLEFLTSSVPVPGWLLCALVFMAVASLVMHGLLRGRNELIREMDARIEDLITDEENRTAERDEAIKRLDAVENQIREKLLVNHPSPPVQLNPGMENDLKLLIARMNLAATKAQMDANRPVSNKTLTPAEQAVLNTGYPSSVKREP